LAARQWLAGSFDILHSPAAYIVPARRALRILTIHDLYCMIEPSHVETYGGSYFAATYPRKLAGLDHIIAISEFTRGELDRVFGFDPARVSVIYHGVDLERFSPEPAAGDALMRRSLGLAEPYFLAVGTIEPRKNMPGLLKIYAALSSRLEAEGRKPPLLVVAGQPGWGNDAFETALQSMARPQRASCGWGTSPTKSCLDSIAAHWGSVSPRSTKALACPSLKRWPAAAR
jgi:glycosyltransferase involved in cell wall biosynthesis